MKKLNLILIIVILLMPSLNVKATPWNISTAVYTNVVGSTEDTAPVDIFFNASGTKMYISGDVDDAISQYILGTPWDLSTATFQAPIQSIGGRAGGTNPFGIFFNGSGKRLFFIDDVNNMIFQYTLSTDWNVTTATYDNINLSIAGQSTAANDLFFNASGNKMYVLGGTSVFQYTLSTPWALSTATYDSINFSVSSQTSSSIDLFFNASGNKMYILSSSTIHQYGLGTAWNISTATYENTNFSQSQDSSAFGLFINGSGTRFYIVGDATNNIYQYNMPAESTKPIVNTSFNISLSNIRINNILNISANITDDTGLSICQIIENQTGIYNYTNITLSGTSAQCSNKIFISQKSVINFTIRVNDTSNNIRTNDTIITIANTVPNGTNFVNTTGKHYNSNITRLNWTPADNPDKDVLRYVVYWDLDATPTSLYYNGTDLNISTNWTSDNTYFYQIKVMDDISESALSPVFNLTLDTGLLTLTTNCTNNTITRFNQTCLFSIEDPFPYNLSVLVNRNGNDYHLKTNSTTTNRFINITFLLNLTEDGNYTIYINASDSDKTSPVISDKLSNWKVKNELLRFNTSKGQGINLDIKFKGNAPPSNFNSFTYLNSKGTHIIFGVNYTANATDLLPVFNVKGNGINIAYLNDSIKGHFVFFPYGLDFEGKLLVNGTEKSYNVSVKRISGINYQIEIIPNGTINVGDNIKFISESVFGLNTIDIFFNYVVDQTDQNIRNISPSNNTFTNSAVNFTANITEINPDKMELWINSTGIWHLNRTASYSNNITANFSLFTLAEGVFIWTVCANDTAGGRNCFAQNYTLIVDNTSPTITLNNPPDSTVITDIEKPNINFRFSSNELVKNCSLFIGGLSANDSTQKDSYNFTIKADIGVSKWNATCYDRANNYGTSGTFRFEVNLISGGASSTPQSAGGGGIGLPLSLKNESDIEQEKVYSLTYICNKIKEFLNTTPDYDLSDIVLLQENIRFEANIIIPFTTLKGYADKYEQFCILKKEQKVTGNVPNQSDLISKFFSEAAKNPFWDFSNYLKLPLNFNLGQNFKSKENNARGLYDFINIMFPLSVSDSSENQNVVWEGKIRILPLIILSVVILVAIFITRYYRLLNKVIKDE